MNDVKFNFVNKLSNLIDRMIEKKEMVNEIQSLPLQWTKW